MRWREQYEQISAEHRLLHGVTVPVSTELNLKPQPEGEWLDWLGFSVVFIIMFFNTKSRLSQEPVLKRQEAEHFIPNYKTYSLYVLMENEEKSFSGINAKS